VTLSPKQRREDSMSATGRLAMHYLGGTEVGNKVALRPKQRREDSKCATGGLGAQEPQAAHQPCRGPCLNARYWARKGHVPLEEVHPHASTHNQCKILRKRPYFSGRCASCQCKRTESMTAVHTCSLTPPRLLSCSHLPFGSCHPQPSPHRRGLA
jgi:hypothetical protein